VTELDGGLDLGTKLTRARSILVHRVQSVFTRKGPTATRRLAPAPKVERTGVSGGDSVARQRTLVGDSLNDEEWCDDLSVVMSDNPVRRPQGGKGTNLSLSEDGQEDIRGSASSAPRSNKQ